MLNVLNAMLRQLTVVQQFKIDWGEPFDSILVALEAGAKWVQSPCMLGLGVRTGTMVQNDCMIWKSWRILESHLLDSSHAALKHTALFRKLKRPAVAVTGHGF